MIVGAPKEIKTGENRVGLTPVGAKALVAAGHRVLVQHGAGEGSGFPDAEYGAAGAELVSRADAWGAELVVKVKEPIGDEFTYFRPGLVLFTYLHLVAAPKLTRELVNKRVTAIGYETVQVDGELPLRDPMSAVAGRMAVQVGAHYLERTHGGSGKLLGGAPGVAPAQVTVIGAGVVGFNAAEIAAGMQAKVIVIDRNEARLLSVRQNVAGNVRTVVSSPDAIGDAVAGSDLVIGAVAITGALAPRLITRQMLRRMRAGSVFVDVAIDQGGCAETSRATTHEAPVYVEEGVIHYCVSNMPGAVPHTSTLALTSVTHPFVLALAEGGLCALDDPSLRAGVNTHEGKLTYAAVAEALGMDYSPLEL